MPEPFEVKKGRDIGKPNIYGTYIWLKCPVCKKERWVEYTSYKRSGKIDIMCSVCSGRKQGRVNSKKLNKWKC